MLIAINKARHLDLIGEDIPNDENLERYIMVKVSPMGENRPANSLDEMTLKVGVADGLAYNIPNEVATTFMNIATGRTITGGNENVTD